MKTCNAQIEEVKDLLDNISGLAISYDCLSGEEDMKGLIDSMADWAREALVILEKLPRDSRGKEEINPQSGIRGCRCYHTCVDGSLLRVIEDCPIHGAKK